MNLNMLLDYLAKNNIPTVVTLHDCGSLRENVFILLLVSVKNGNIGVIIARENKADVKSLFFDRSRSVFEDKKKYFQRIAKLTVVGCSRVD